mmetsp:Transcript_30899/g.71399  ORF Transcript_30899/g.71399 Transcript_30899/m.71399 type:complete len:200 (+) Transcript_30899:1024-1623(+)
MASTAGSEIGAFSAAIETSSSSSSSGSGPSSPSDPSPRSAAAAVAMPPSAFGDKGAGKNESSISDTFMAALPSMPSVPSALSSTHPALTRPSRIRNFAITAALPPRRMSVPRPAMFVATVTAPMRPAWLITSPSRSQFSGFAFNTRAKMPRSLRAPAISSLSCTDVVPIKTGRPASCTRATSLSMALTFASFVLKTTSG